VGLQVSVVSRRCRGRSRRPTSFGMGNRTTCVAGANTARLGSPPVRDRPRVRRGDRRSVQASWLLLGRTQFQGGRDCGGLYPLAYPFGFDYQRLLWPRYRTVGGCAQVRSTTTVSLIPEHLVPDNALAVFSTTCTALPDTQCATTPVVSGWTLLIFNIHQVDFC
jgi:hypothetical protein